LPRALISKASKFIYVFGNGILKSFFNVARENENHSRVIKNKSSQIKFICKSPKFMARHKDDSLSVDLKIGRN
jgi:hypothetical protein